MPFTAFHIGPGLLAKGVAPRAQSLVFFAACNVAFDIEPGVRMWLGHDELHTYTHNPVSFTLIVIACARLWDRLQRTGWGQRRMPQLSRKQYAWTGVWAVVSHLVLDAMFHVNLFAGDLREFMFIGSEDAQLVAVGMGVIGTFLIALRWVSDAVEAFRQRMIKRMTTSRSGTGNPPAPLS